MKANKIDIRMTFKFTDHSHFLSGNSNVPWEGNPWLEMNFSNFTVIDLPGCVDNRLKIEDEWPVTVLIPSEFLSIIDAVYLLEELTTTFHFPFFCLISASNWNACLHFSGLDWSRHLKLKLPLHVWIWCVWKFAYFITPNKNLQPGYMCRKPRRITLKRTTSHNRQMTYIVVNSSETVSISPLFDLIGIIKRKKLSNNVSSLINQFRCRQTCFI